MISSNQSNYHQMYGSNLGRRFTRLMNPKEMPNLVARRVVNIGTSLLASATAAVVGGGALKLLDGGCQSYMWELFNLCGDQYGKAGLGLTFLLSGISAAFWYRTYRDW